VGVDLRDRGSPLAFTFLDRPSNKPCDGDQPETDGIITPSFEPATGYPSFAEIIERVEASTALSSVAKRDLKSAITRTIGTWMGRDLAATPADIPWLRKQMADWTAARFGVSEGTFNTVRSQLNRALKVSGIRQSRVRHRKLEGSWLQLDEALERYWGRHRQTAGKPREGNWLQIRLRRFMGWCEEHCIAPSQVNDSVIEHFIDDDAQAALRGNPEERERGLRKAWNHAAEKIRGWPPTTVAKTRNPPTKPGITFKESQFEASFITELDAYAENRGFFQPADQIDCGQLSFLEKARRRRARSTRRIRSTDGQSIRSRQLKPLADDSIYVHRRTLIMTASALVLCGVKSIEDIRFIADVIGLEGAACLMDLLEQRQKHSFAGSSYPQSLITMLFSIMARCGIQLPPEEVDAMHELALEVGAGRDAGACTLTAKNRERVAQFDDPDNFALLVSCAEWEMSRLETERRSAGCVTKAMAIRAEAAIGNLILCTLPVRRRALATTDWRRNFRPPTRRGGNATLIYHPEQSKTKRPQQVILEGWKWRLIETYWKHYRPLLCGADKSTYLFPGNTPSGHKTSQKLADAITNLVRKRTGLVMNLHLWRHVMGAMLLEEHEDMRLVEELLGHVPGSRATRRYAELKTKWAAKRLDGITEQARGRGLHLHRRQGVRHHRRQIIG
jgi:Phage integrase family